MLIDEDVSLTRLVAYYRTAAAKLRRAYANNDGNLPTRHSETQEARMNWVLQELADRGETGLRAALVGERYAHETTNAEKLASNRSIIRKITKVEKDAQRRADEALAYRLELVDRFETLYEIHGSGDEEARIAQTTLVERLAWDRATLNIAEFEERFSDIERGATKWYWTFLDLYDVAKRGRRIEFSQELDGLIEWHYLEQARQAGFVSGARVVWESMAGVRLGRVSLVETVTNASRTATTVGITVTWDDGLIARGGMQHFTLLGDRSQLGMVAASIFYKHENDPERTWVELGNPAPDGDGLFEDAQAVAREIVDLIESGAEEIRIEGIDRIR